EVVSKAIEIAREAVAGGDVLVALDIGPIGQLLRPTGTLSFDEAYDIFAEIVRAGVKSKEGELGSPPRSAAEGKRSSRGADLVALQTFSDLLELKAAILAVKENSDLPVIASMTFEATGRTFTGTPASAFAITASSLGADIIGTNCGLGPLELRSANISIVDELLKYSTVPVMVKPNAGLPDPNTGAFTLGAEDFAREMQAIAAKGVKVLGGCCGTSPEYIRLLGHSGVVTAPYGVPSASSAICSGVKTVILDGVQVIGERINPTGKARFKAALKEAQQGGDIDYILAQGLEQAAAGADILDVNVGLPEIDEKAMMIRVVEGLQSVCDLPLQIDSGDAEVLEAALRRYCGKPIVNSVNGKEESLQSVLPLVRKYGAAVIALTLDESGIPATALGRLEVARKIVQRAEELGIPRSDIIVDCLTMSVSTDSQAAQTTLEAVRLVKRELGVKTALGVSNVSFGLPERGIINAAFLTLALEAGLDLPIINPNAPGEMNAVRAFRLLAGKDANAADYVAAYSENKHDNDSNLAIYAKQEAIANTRELLKTHEPLEVINAHLVPTLNKVGQDYECGKIFLPQLILSAETVAACFEEVKAVMGDSAAPLSENKVILATVQGDIHDIGKNIVKVLLQSYGYKVIDLGRDVAPETIAEAVKTHGARLVGLSALMTTTLPPMERTIALLKEQGLPCKVMVGGAVLTADYAAQIGADYYGKDAKAAVDIAQGLTANN
ncbi:MAG: dihydropteroate synthase, partial [Oscillospiraceae bacterium]|nr:dihydropteroate synthase [Oscillospiraceae bacterium]